MNQDRCLATVEDATSDADHFSLGRDCALVTPIPRAVQEAVPAAVLTPPREVTPGRRGSLTLHFWPHPCRDKLDSSCGGLRPRVER
jgi:hypothetical protein